MINRRLLTIFSILITEIMGFGLIIPVLPQIALQFHSSTLAIGILVASYSFFQMISAPVLGLLSDKYGRRKVMLFSLAGTLISYILIIFSQSFWLLLFARSLDGATGGNVAVARAYISDITTPEERPKGMAYIGIAFGVGFFLGPAIGSIIFTAGYGFKLAAFISSFLVLVSLALTYFYLDEVTHNIQEKKSYNFLNTLRHPSVWPLLLATFTFYLMANGFHATISIFTTKFFEYTPAENSYLFALIGILTIATQSVLAKGLKTKPFYMLVAGVMIFSVGLFALGIVKTSLILILVIMFKTIGHGIVATYMPSVLSNVRQMDADGELLGMFESIVSLARILGPIIYGFLYSFNGSIAFFIMSVVGLSSIPLILYGKNLISRRPRFV